MSPTIAKIRANHLLTRFIYYDLTFQSTHPPVDVRLVDAVALQTESLDE